METTHHSLTNGVELLVGPPAIFEYSLVFSNHLGGKLIGDEKTCPLTKFSLEVNKWWCVDNFEMCVQPFK